MVIPSRWVRDSVGSLPEPGRCLHAAETVALAATWVAFAITVAMLESGLGREANPVVAGLFDSFGYGGAALAALLVTVSAFRVLEYGREVAPRAVATGAVSLAAVSLVDAVRNATTFAVIDVGVVTPALREPAVSAFAIVLVAWIARVELARLGRAIDLSIEPLTRKQIAAIFHCVLLISSFAMVPLFAANPATGATTSNPLTTVNDTDAPLYETGWENDSLTNYDVTESGSRANASITDTQNYSGNRSLYIKTDGNINDDEVYVTSKDTFNFSVDGEFNTSYALRHDFYTPGSSEGYVSVRLVNASDGSVLMDFRTEDSADHDRYRILGSLVEGSSDSSVPITSNTWQEYHTNYNTETGEVELYVDGQLAVSSKFTGTPGELENAKVEFFQKNYIKDSTGDTWTDDVKIQSGPGFDRTAGAVVDQHGDRVGENVTVELWGPRETAFSTSDADQLAQESDELLEQMSDPLPDEWNPDMDLSGHMSDADTNYVAVHTESDWELDALGRTSNLENPKLNPPADHPIALSVWHPPGEATVENHVDSSLHGATTEQNIVVKKIDPAGGVEDTWTLEPNEKRTTGSLTWEREHPYAVTRLPAGIYRVYPEGNEQTAYTIAVGDTDQLASAIQESYEQEISKLNEQEKEIRERLNNDTVWRTTVTTDANGEWTADVPPNVVTVQAQAYDVPAYVSSDPQNATYADIRGHFETGSIDNQTVILSTDSTRFEPPTSDATITVQRHDTSEWVTNVEEFSNRFQELWDQWRNETMAEWESMYEDRLENATLESLKNRFADLRAVIEANDELREAYLERSDRDEIAAADNLTRDELETEIGHMRQTLYSASSGSITPNDPIVSEGLLSMEFPTSGDAEYAMVELVWSDGTVEHMPYEYYSIESGGVLGGDTVVVDDYPLEENADGRALANVRVTATMAEDEGIVSDGDDDSPPVERGSAPVTVPAFGGDIPAIDAIDVSTTAPGPDERVTFGLEPEPGTGYGSLEHVNVTGPAGTEIATEITDSDRGAFRTDGAGVHFVRATYSNSQGDLFVLTFRLNARENSIRTGPEVVVTEYAGGTVALAGEGLENAHVENAGDTLSVSATIPGDESAPARIDVKPGQHLTKATEYVEVSVLQGADEKTIDSHVQVAIHVDRGISDDTLLWRNGDAFRQSGEDRFGEVEEHESGKDIVRTYTDADGYAEIRMDQDPDPWTRASHWYAVTVPDVSLPFSLSLSGPSAIAGVVVAVSLIGAVLARRRRKQG